MEGDVSTRVVGMKQKQVLSEIVKEVWWNGEVVSVQVIAMCVEGAALKIKSSRVTERVTSLED